MFNLGLFHLSPVNAQGGFECIVEEPSANFISSEIEFSTEFCSFENIDSADMLQLAEFIVYVNFHFVGDEGGNNFHCDPNGDPSMYAPQVVEDLLYRANDYLIKPRKDLLGTSEKLPDTRIRLKLYTDPENPNDPCGGIFFHEWNENVLHVINSGNVHQTVYGAKVLHVNIRDEDDTFQETDPTKIITRGSTDQMNRITMHNMLWRFRNNDSDLWTYARMLDHELAHCFNLPHSFSCHNTCYDMDNTLECAGPACTTYQQGGQTIQCPSNPAPCYYLWGGSGKDRCCYCTSQSGGNNLMGYSIPQIAITRCQWETMFTRILSKNWTWGSFCIEEEEPLYIDTGEHIVWDNMKLLNRDVIVRPGASLTITCEVRMGEGKRIIVRRGGRLVVDKGKITKLCDGKWAGIAVHGNVHKVQPDTLPGQQALDDAGIVIIRNNSLVEHAITAISTSAPDYFWDYNEQTSRWGGLVHAIDARFENNKRVAEFMKYDFPNASVFHNCTLEDGEQGVTIWRTNGIHFSRNRFYNLSSNGVLTHNAGAIVTDGNSFENNGRGIRTFASHPMATNNGWMIIGETDEEPNKFENNVVHIHAEASDYGSAMNVYNNEFFGGKVSVWSFGPSRFDLRHNVFDTQDQASVVLSRTGALGVNQLNYVRNNFIKAPRGIFGIGENRELQFLCNQFLSGEDFVLGAAKGSFGQILAPGQIRFQQGSSLASAGNCFTDPQQIGDIITLHNETVSFTYYAFSAPSAPACLVPVTSGNYSVAFSFGNTCEEPGPGFNDKASLLDYIDILDDIAVSQGAASTTAAQLAALEEEKSWIFHHLLNGYYEAHDTTALFHLLSLENSHIMQMMKFGLELNLGNFTAAAATLDSLPNTIPEMTDFKQIQQINMARMQQGLAYTMPTADSVYLESIAQSEMGVKSYARAILSLVYGLEFNDVLEDGEVHLEERQTLDEAASLPNTPEKRIRVFPNPANDGFTVAMEGFEPGQLRVVSVLGAPIYTQALTSGTVNVYVPTAEWSDGVYFLQIFDAKGAQVHAARISVTH